MRADLVVKAAGVLMFFLPGLMAVVVGLRGSRWFFESGGVSLVRKYLGLQYARLFYVVLGLLLIACGVLILVDPLEVMSTKVR